MTLSRRSIGDQVRDPRRARMAPRTVADALATARRLLVTQGIPEPGLEAAVLLGHILGGRQRAWLLSHGDEGVARADASCYLALIERRCRREPSAYLVGVKHWLDMAVEVNRNVLIPRPETEILALDAISIARQFGVENPLRPSIVDVGTGSGAIAIALARAHPDLLINAVDSSSGALDTAKANAMKFGARNIDFAEGSLLSTVSGAIDLLVANLPYVRSGDIAGLEPETMFEPRDALDGGENGLNVIFAMLDEARHHIAAGGSLLLECGFDQGSQIGERARAIWPGALVSIKRDYAGLERFVRIALI